VQPSGSTAAYPRHKALTWRGVTPVRRPKAAWLVPDWANRAVKAAWESVFKGFGIEASSGLGANMEQLHTLIYH
jgi:hypothetical protein